MMREETHCQHFILISSKGFFYMHRPTGTTVHTSAFVTPIVKHWLVQDIAAWVDPTTHCIMNRPSTIQ